MENQQVFYKVDRWARRHSDIVKVIATRTTDKTIWFMRNNREQRELLSSSYYQYCTSENHAKAIIDSRNEAEADRQNKKRLSDAAPALLEALEAITESMATVCDNCYWSESDFPAIQKARAAIAAARGTV